MEQNKAAEEVQAKVDEFFAEGKRTNPFLFGGDGFGVGAAQSAI